MTEREDVEEVANSIQGQSQPNETNMKSANIEITSEQPNPTESTETPPQAEDLTDGTKTEASKPKKAAGEVFQELKSVVIGMEYKLDEISRFVHLAKDKLTRQAEEYTWEGKIKVLESFFELYDMLFRRTMAMESGSLEPDSFCIELMQFVQEILKKHGVEVIIPQPGDRFDMNYMESLRGIPARFWRLPDTVANVEKCGYSIQINETNEKVLRPARVNVYRKQTK